VRTYQPIWHRIRANPGIRVPIECPTSYMQRVILAVKKERGADKLYNRISAARNKTGIVYKSTAPHAEKQGIAVVSFILIEYAAVGLSDLKYLVRYPPDRDLMDKIGVKELEAEYYSSVKSDMFADMNYENKPPEPTNDERFAALLKLVKEMNNADTTRNNSSGI